MNNLEENMNVRPEEAKCPEENESARPEETNLPEEKKGIWARLWSFIKFGSSSLIAFGIDEAGLLLLSPHVGTVWANIISRVVSATANFTLNHFVVFRSNEDIWKAAVKYTLLALAVLAADTVMLKCFFIDLLGLQEWIAKPITEAVLFCINYPIQKLFVYRKMK